MSTRSIDPRGTHGSPHSSLRRARIPPGTSTTSSATRPDIERGGSDSNLAVGDRPYTVSRPRTGSTSSQTLGRTPARSYVHRSFDGPLDPAQYSSEGLREQTAELASLAADDNLTEDNLFSSGEGHPAVILEESEPSTPAAEEPPTVAGPSRSDLTAMLADLPVPGSERALRARHERLVQSPSGLEEEEDTEPNERTALVTDRKQSIRDNGVGDVEDQTSGKLPARAWRATALMLEHGLYTVTHPKTWNARAIWREAVVHPFSLLPAVFLGLLLNILDALSYGMILFPLGTKIFSDLGSDGIAMFYVSTIVSQAVFSGGGSIFRGGIGSEMIEVVPFMHQMALRILNRVGEDNVQSVLATTILSFAISSILTGAVFFLLGACKLGSLIGFFPRHILIGSIGGVGWFLVATGIEVSARLSGSLEYNLATLQQLFHKDTAPLWLVPLGLAFILMIIQHYYHSNFLVGGYFIIIVAIFYIVKAAAGIEMATLNAHGWVFDAPPSGKPWYHFYTLYNFREVHWGALADTIPEMFALTFFGILHVPINVPALGISTGEDDLNVDRELIAHGLSNCLSGMLGSIQNYLAYTNSLLFISSGGNDRLAGLMLAAATFGILVAGPTIVGYIPVMVVGALIFLLGIELLHDALIGTIGKVNKLEYATIVVIVVTMGVYDFVAGILAGIVLAALNFVLQTSRRTAIRATFSGQTAHSTVRRPPVQSKFLRETGEQTHVIKVAGFLFFGSIVGVENEIRALLTDDAFKLRPLRFLVLDMVHVVGVDYSAAEAFTRINRLLKKREVNLVVSGLDLESDVGRALRNVGLFNGEEELPVFETLNQALENCENQLLRALYRQQEARRSKKTTTHLDVPRKSSGDFSSSYRAEFLVSSPRHSQLHNAAATTLAAEPTSGQKWQSFKQPLPLILNIFEEDSGKNEDFWHRAVPYFEKVHIPKSSVIFNIGDRPSAFYLLEQGMLRADYDLPQGKFAELIVKGRPCGELPFFSDTPRTASMTAEQDSDAWQLTGPKWQELQANDPQVAQELLKMSLKLTKERMDVITSYILTVAS